MKNYRPCLIMILDGWGKSDIIEGNAVKAADTPNLDYYIQNYSVAELKCSGEEVGLPAGVMGNSEVGHLNIGAGRIVYQDLLRIDKSIDDKTFFDNAAFNEVFDKTVDSKGKMHLFGLLSDGKVHSSLKHLFALIDMAVAKGVKTVIHPILDGRDTPPESGIGYIKALEEKILTCNNVCIGSVCGRFYAMDRDKRWERVEKAYNLYTKGQGNIYPSASEAVEAYYAKKITDEFIEPAVIGSLPENLVSDKDGVIFFNFRADRAREITQAFTDKNFDSFKRDKFLDLCGYVCMTTYDKTFDAVDVAFGPLKLENNLGEVVSNAGLSQLRIAETEKYAHVTYFFNGGIEEPNTGEERLLVPSPRDIETYDQKPEMSAKKVCDKFLKAVQEKDYHLMVLNYANMDMVGHTGIFDAAKTACETVDKYVKPVVDAVLEKGGAVLITADHGNSEKMRDENGGVHTAHTTNPVNLILIDDKSGLTLKDEGKLGDIAPTALKIIGLDIPKEMTGFSLIK